MFRVVLRRRPTAAGRRLSSRAPCTPVYARARAHRWRTAVVDGHGRHTYGQILDSSTTLADRLRAEIEPLRQVDAATGPRVAFLCPNDVGYVVAQWTSWLLGAVAVPLSPSHPASELEYFLADSQSDLVLTSDAYSDVISPIAKRLNIAHVELGRREVLSETMDEAPDYPAEPTETEDHLTSASRKRAAMILYTSGTTGRPKGVVHTHESLYANIDMMTRAWDMSQSDTLLHVLPLHHTHGIVNCLMTPLSVGATCLMMPKFDAEKVWSALLHPLKTDDLLRVNVFMAVPTIYAKLVRYMNDNLANGDSGATLDFIRSTCTSKIRLMVSGSAALPEPVMRAWERLTGHRLLERYGMTETGMVLTNPLDGPRIGGTVGFPFPGIEVRIGRPNVYSETGYDVISTGTHRSTTVTPDCSEESGDLLVKGPNLFREYWNKPDATQETFTSDGWFKTGDTAVYRGDEKGGYQILGRTSVDIIKSGGYKVSALDVERHLLAHPSIEEIAVVGLPDLVWGQKIAAVCVLKHGTNLTLPQLRQWAANVMPPYQIPSQLNVVHQLKKNAMGKINKKDIVKLYFSNSSRSVL